MSEPYTTDEPARAVIDAMAGPAIVEFGNNWCGHCQAAQPLVAAAMKSHPAIRHLKIADGPGRPLGRSFKVKLWPTLIFLEAGVEVARLVRPAAADEIEKAIASIDSARS